MKFNRDAFYTGALRVSGLGVVLALLQVLEALLLPLMRGPEYAPLYAGRLRAFSWWGAAALAAFLAFFALRLRLRRQAPR